MPERFIVTELDGWQTHYARGGAGISVHVRDTAINHRLVAVYRSEDYTAEPGRWGRPDAARKCEIARERAADTAARMNRECAQ